MTTAAEIRAGMLAAHGEILGQETPAFSDAEMARREAALLELAAALGLGAVLVVEAARAGSATGWLTGWPVTAEAVTVLGPGLPRTMFVQHHNHLPQARRIAWRTEVAWGGASGLAAAAGMLGRGGVTRVGVIGRLPPAQLAGLAEVAAVTDLNAAYARLRRLKSAEETRWMELAAALTDLGLAALAEGARPGMTERELGALVESGFLPHGATSFIHYFLATPMRAPGAGVPRQYPSPRPLARGDVLATEISADFWGYTGQVLRTFFLGEEPTPLYRELHDVAEATLDAVLARVRPGAMPAELVEASAGIEAAGFTIIDDLVHGYGGGYLAPVLGSASRPAAGPVPEVALAESMCLVVQPNIVTPDGRAGVQTGHLVQVTAEGWRALQRVPRGWRVIG